MRPVKTALSLATLGLMLATPATAQGVGGKFIGGFDRYGSGCPGSNPQLGCVSVNMRLPISAGNSYASIPWATLIPGGGSRVIRSITFMARTRAPNSLAPGKTFRVPVSIFGSALGRPTAPLRTALITFNGFLRLLTFTVTPPLPQAKGQNLFLVFDIRNTTGVALPVTGHGGARSPTFMWRSVWQRSPFDLHWQYNVSCVRNGAPELTEGGWPKYGPNINRPFDLLLRGARPNSLALLATGFQRVGVDLTPHGAAGCTLLVSPIMVTAGRTNAGGTLLVRSGVPNMPSLLRVTFLTQFAVRDTTNALGLTFTNGLAGQIGNL